jgi:hypothetical protein
VDSRYDRQRLGRRRRRSPGVIALSAVIGDSNGLERWLNVRLLRRGERPVSLDEAGIPRRWLVPLPLGRGGTETVEAHVQKVSTGKNSG